MSREENQMLNSLELYRGQNPATIKMLLMRQSEAVVKLLKEKFNTDDLNELALRCSIGH